MLTYILRRLYSMLFIWICISMIGFLIIELPPGSYVDIEINRLRQMGGDLTGDQIKALEMEFGVNDPFVVKYVKWISNFVQGDFSYSFQYRLPVKDLIWARIGYTALITIMAMLLNWIVAIFVGVYSATHRLNLPDYLITIFQFIGLSVPPFLLALVLMVVAQKVFGLNVGGLFSLEYRDAPWSIEKIWDLAKHIWLPIVVIAAHGTAWLSRVMRSNLLDVLNLQYVQTARAKGVSENVVIWKHATRNAMHPLVMVLGASLPALISGETITAIVLNMPTIGPLYFDALLNKDMYLAATLLMFMATLLLFGNLLADILLAWLDPRIRYD